jgi:O-antigen biosynthesis protein
MKALLSGLGQLVMFVFAPVVLLVTVLALAGFDLLFLMARRKRVKPASVSPVNSSASIVIPNWNGRDLLEKYLPSVVAAAAPYAGSEIIVVDNASHDGSAAFLRENFPSVRVLAQEKNLGFGGGSNAGFRAAKNDIVVLLNSDMRVDENFLRPLLAPFTDPDIFAVACQIFFADPTIRREETGLTQATWSHGRLLLRHRLDDRVQTTFPCFYPGGGSSAFDRRKFLELGGFDEILRPFYFEDTDLGYMAWKRGWKVLYEPRSIVFHQHRGTIGKKFSKAHVDRVLKKNVLLMTWKNVHDWKMLSEHLWKCFISASGALLGRRDPNRHTFAGIYRAFFQLPELLGSRWKARDLAYVTDREALRLPLGGYYRDRFQVQTEPEERRLKVLFVTPYPIEPPVHGGAVFMKQTLEELRPLADIHLAGFIESKSQFAAQEPLRSLCASMHFQVRAPLFDKSPATLLPHGVREFYDADLEWALHRILFTERIDVVQLEYTLMGQYAGRYQYIPCMLFEHDVFFQSVGRQMKGMNGGQRREQFLEYLRLLRYEPRMLKQMDRVQMCSEPNREYLLGFAPELAPKIDSDLRAGIRVSQYAFHQEGRCPDTLLFVGSFRHLPNQEALNWFVKDVLPRVVAKRPVVKLLVVGSQPPPALMHLKTNPHVELTGFVTDIRDPLSTCAVFVCPILSGSGIRVKLLEAFAAGIPSVSTRVGAEGLAEELGMVCELGDTAEDFADGVLRLLEDPLYAKALARAARRHVEEARDVKQMTRKLENVYRRAVSARRGAATAKAPATSLR